MTRIDRLVICFVIVISGLACGIQQAEPPIVSEAGYVITLRTAPERIWMAPPVSTVANNYLGFGEIVVQVQDAQGQPLDSVPVAFQVEPAWIQSASVTPQQVLTRGGQARAFIKPSTTGVVNVMVRVNDVTRQAKFLVESQWTNSTGMFVKGLPYPPP